MVVLRIDVVVSNSNIFKIDSKAKFLSVIIMDAFVALAADLRQISHFSIIFLVYLLIFRPKKSIIKKVIAVLPIMFSLGILAILRSEEMIKYSNGISSTFFTREEFAIFLFLKGLLAACFVLILIESEESFIEIVYVLEDLHCPRILASLLFLTWQQLIIISRDMGKIFDAQYARAYGKSRWFNLKSIKVISFTIGSLLARTFQRSETIADMLTSRGFTGRFPHEPKKLTFLGISFFILSLITGVVAY
ncbi:MAG: energy-coupling factor transporter transmembrane component T [Promethearchaeota archaeon]